MTSAVKPGKSQVISYDSRSSLRDQLIFRIVRLMEYQDVPIRSGSTKQSSACVLQRLLRVGHWNICTFAEKVTGGCVERIVFAEVLREGFNSRKSSIYIV